LNSNRFSLDSGAYRVSTHGLRHESVAPFAEIGQQDIVPSAWLIGLFAALKVADVARRGCHQTFNLEAGLGHTRVDWRGYQIVARDRCGEGKKHRLNPPHPLRPA